MGGERLNLRKSWEILSPLYSPFETESETLALELRFWQRQSNHVHSHWLILDDLEARFTEYAKVVKVRNALMRFEGWHSVAVHRWEAVRQKAEASGSLNVKGDSQTVFPEISHVVWDIDYLPAHAGNSANPFTEVQKFYKEVLEPFFKKLGLTPTYVLYTGGGVQVRWLFNDLAPITIFDEMERLLPIINAHIAPKGKADNIFDYARVVRLPLTVNWKYPAVGKVLYENSDPISPKDLVKALTNLGGGLNLAKLSKPSKATSSPKRGLPKAYMYRIDPQLLYTVLRPFYVPGHQNDLLIRLFSILAKEMVDIFDALTLLSLFLHDPRNTPGHLRNRLDHLTYAYGRILSERGLKPEQLYGPKVYGDLASYFNALVSDLGISFKPSDFKRGLTTNKGKIAGYSALKKKLEEIARSVGIPEAEERIFAVLNVIRRTKYAIVEV